MAVIPELEFCKVANWNKYIHFIIQNCNKQTVKNGWLRPMVPVAIKNKWVDF